MITGDSLGKHVHKDKQEFSCLTKESFLSPNLFSYNSLFSSTCIYLKSVKKISDIRLDPREN